MILLDTNVISEPMRPRPTPSVVAWLDAQPMETLYLSAITLAELRAGVALLPSGKRKAQLQANLEDKVIPLFVGRILAFGQECTTAYADILQRTQQAGVAIATADAMIAAIAATHHLTVATRDETPFTSAGATVINPWEIAG